MLDITKDILRVISSSLQIPTIIVLIITIIIAIIMLGSFIAEIFTERRSLKVDIPELIDDMQGKTAKQLKDIVAESGLLKRQKEAIIKLIDRENLPDDTREALARQLLSDEESHYAKITKITDIIARVAPMFGLLGTLIPLGPGLIALGQGDTKTLSGSLLIAFDTTIAGLVSASIAFIVSGIRKAWYEQYIVGLETIMETVLEEQAREKRAKALEEANPKDTVKAEPGFARPQAQGVQPEITREQFLAYAKKMKMMQQMKAQQAQAEAAQAAQIEATQSQPVQAEAAQAAMNQEAGDEN